MKEITETELNCLRRVAEMQSGIISPCNEHDLQRLVSLGLIEQRSGIWLPLEMLRITYHVTSAGRAYLEEH